MTQLPALERIVIHTVCGNHLEFFRPVMEPCDISGMVQIYEEGTPKLRYYFTQIEYVEATFQ